MTLRTALFERKTSWILVEAWCHGTKTNIGQLLPSIFLRAIYYVAVVTTILFGWWTANIARHQSMPEWPLSVMTGLVIGIIFFDGLSMAFNGWNIVERHLEDVQKLDEYFFLPKGGATCEERCKDMSFAELKGLAHKCMLEIASDILRRQRELMDDVVKVNIDNIITIYRTNIKERYDFFLKFGLVDPNGYGYYFMLAEKK